MSDIEKSPLLFRQAASSSAEPTEADLTEARQEVVSAHKSWIEATKAYHAMWRRTRSGRRLSRVHNIILGFALALVAFVIGLMLTGMAFAIFEDDDSLEYYGPKPRIPLEAHIISKCPDTRKALQEIILPTMMEVSHEVDFKLSYIGTPTYNDDGVACKHGPAECLGNIIELCAAKLYPDPKIYLGFTMCLTKQYQDIPQRDLVQDCALEHGISFEELNGCASDDAGTGMDLLRNSVEHSRALNVSISCTIRLDGEIYAIVDDQKVSPSGSSARDLVSKIRELREN